MGVDKMQGKSDQSPSNTFPAPSSHVVRRRALILVAWAAGWAVGFWSFHGGWMVDEVGDLTAHHGWTQSAAEGYVLNAHGWWWNLGFIILLLVISACLFLRASGIDAVNHEQSLEENAHTTDDGLRVG